MVLAGFALVMIAYVLGVVRLWRRAGRGRGVAGWQVASFAAGMAALAAALISPLDRLGEALFSAHMAQHIILTAVAPPLLLLGRPLTLLWSLPPRLRHVAGAWIRTGILPRVWGLTALEDQQLAGLFMWVVCGMIYMITALLLIGAWLRQMQHREAVSGGVPLR